MSQAREAEENAINQAHNQLSQSKAEQAEAR